MALISRLPHGRRGLKYTKKQEHSTDQQSPSSRKAGIEISEVHRTSEITRVAFLTEGGD